MCKKHKCLFLFQIFQSAHQVWLRDHDGRSAIFAPAHKNPLVVGKLEPVKMQMSMTVLLSSSLLYCDTFCFNSNNFSWLSFGYLLTFAVKLHASSHLKYLLDIVSRIKTKVKQIPANQMWLLHSLRAFFLHQKMFFVVSKLVAVKMQRQHHAWVSVFLFVS